MRVLVVSHESGLEHDAGRDHSERPERLHAVRAGLELSGSTLVDVSAPRIDRESLYLVHSSTYVEHLKRFCTSGGGLIDPDTRVGPGSWEAALRSAAGGIGAIEGLDAGRADCAFVAMRPPGHHALPSRAMGFCLFNNIALAARLLTRRGARVAIVDWDVHHGNGTQEVFYRDGNVYYVSLHESPWYPGTGDTRERGAGDGHGSNLNLPLPAGTRGAVYRWLAAHVIVPEVDAFGPDWLLISAGYDAHSLDPLAHINLVEEDYGAMAGALRNVVPLARTILFLEGGYHLDALKSSVAATVRGLAGEHEALPGREEAGSSASWAAARRAADAGVDLR